MMISDGEATISYNNINGMMDKYERFGTKASYDYDELTGLRISKTVNGKVTRFILDNLGRVVEEQDGFENTIAQIVWDGDLPAQYIFGNQTYNYRCNSHGDVVALLDQNGTEVNSYTYDIWGKLVKCNESIPNSIRYNHEYQDEETGFYYLRGRYYNPVIRRFTTPDPAEDGINWYAYCGNNPIQYIDPSGYAYFELKEKWSEGLTINQYYSGADLAALCKPTSAREDIFLDALGALASYGFTFVADKVTEGVTGLSIPLVAGAVAAVAVPFALTKYTNDEIACAAFEAYKQGKGLLIIQTISPDSAVFDIPKPKIVPAKDVEDFAVGKRKPELLW